ncbi:MAG: hypothetical protein LBP78_08390, partial [Acidaminococcales bacterium]|nr:hypothetical protein [Acidaminococcales bacterium]
TPHCQGYKMGCMEKDKITMSQKQINRYDIISKAIANFITVSLSPLSPHVRRIDGLLPILHFFYKILA